MSEPGRKPRFTRRHWLRELVDALVATYRDVTSMFRGPDGQYDMKWFVYALIAYQFIRLFPETWSDPELALALILFAPALYVLFEQVPASEALAALTALLGGVAGKVRSRFTRTTEESESTSIEPTSIGTVPQAAPLGVAGDQRPEGEEVE